MAHGSKTCCSGHARLPLDARQPNLADSIAQ